MHHLQVYVLCMHCVCIYISSYSILCSCLTFYTRSQDHSLSSSQRHNTYSHTPALKHIMIAGTDIKYCIYMYMYIHIKYHDVIIIVMWFTFVRVYVRGKLKLQTYTCSGYTDDASSVTLKPLFVYMLIIVV